MNQTQTVLFFIAFVAAMISFISSVFADLGDSKTWNVVAAVCNTITLLCLAFVFRFGQVTP